MKIALGNDHAGFDEPAPYYKPELLNYLQSKGHEVLDFGCHSAEAVDYPDIANAVANSVATGEADTGILLCGTGIGISIAANRNPKIRAAVCSTPYMAQVTREHNDANILCIGRRVLTLDECFTIIDIWLNEEFNGAERHQRRIDKMS